VTRNNTYAEVRACRGYAADQLESINNLTSQGARGAAHTGVIE